MTTVYDAFTEDENIQNLLEEVAEANPEADEVMEHVYRGHSMDQIQVFGVNSDEVELPEETHGFDLSVCQPWWRHEDVDQERKQKARDIEDLARRLETAIADTYDREELLELISEFHDKADEISELEEVFSGE